VGAHRAHELLLRNIPLLTLAIPGLRAKCLPAGSLSGWIPIVFEAPC
jgi:hypothetical protein